MPGKRVTWDENELEALADEVAKLRIDLPQEGLTALVLKAQKTVFDPDRQRKILTYSQVGPEFMKLLKRSLQDKMGGHVISSAKAAEPIIEYLPADEDEVLIKCGTLQMTQELTARFFQWVEGITTALLKPGTSVTQIVRETIQPDRKSEIVLARLGIAGLSAAHFRALQNRVGPVADLRFVAQERPQAPPSMQHVIVVGSAKRYWKGFQDDRVLYCEQGGLSEVTAFIKKLIPPSSTG